MLAVNGAIMKPSRSLMLTKVRFAESDSELNVYLRQQQTQVSDMAASRLEWQQTQAADRDQTTHMTAWRPCSSDHTCKGSGSCTTRATAGALTRPRSCCSGPGSRCPPSSRRCPSGTTRLQCTTHSHVGPPCPCHVATKLAGRRRPPVVTSAEAAALASVQSGHEITVPKVKGAHPVR